MCDSCGETLNVGSYDDDPPRCGWARRRPPTAPGLDSWQCPDCQLLFPEVHRLRERPRPNRSMRAALFAIIRSGAAATADVGHYERDERLAGDPPNAA